MMSEVRAGALPISPLGKIGIIGTLNGKLWVLPKGHVEKGETVQQAVLREACEEVGVLGFIKPHAEPLITSHIQPMWFYSSDADKDKPDEERTTESINVCIITYWYRVEVTEFVPQEDKRDVRWVEEVEALALLKFPAHKAVVTQLGDGDPFKVVEA